MMASVHGRSPNADAAQSLIRQHYADFNARGIERAASRFDPDAAHDIAGRVERGPEGYRQFAAWWLAAFPDATFTVRDIQARESDLYDIELLAEGTHNGTLAYGAWKFRPTHLEVRLHARQLFQIADGLIRFSTLSFDVQDLVRQLTAVDMPKLMGHLARIQELREQLASASTPAMQRELIDRLGTQLDAARHIVRPYFR